VAIETRSWRLDRRNLFRKTLTAGVGMAVGAKTLSAEAGSSAKARFSARFQGGGEITFSAQTTDTNLIQPFLDEYTETTGVKINTAPAQYGDLYTQLNIALTQASGAYDVVSLDDPWMPQFAGGEFIMNLQELLDARSETLDTDFIPQLVALGDFPKGTGLRGIPWVGNVQVLAWRTDVLEEMGAEVPATWDDVLALATQITEAKSADGLYGIGLRGAPGNPAATSFLPVLRGFGVDVLKPDTFEPQLDTPEAAAAMDLHLQLAKQTPPGVETVQHDDNGRNLREGKIAMSHDIWPDLLLLAFDPSVSQVVGKIEVGAEPAQSGVAPANMTGNWLLGIPEGSQNVDLALDFILWLTSADVQKRMMLDASFPPATRASVLEDPEVVEKLPFTPGLLAAAKNALPRPRTPFYGAVEEIYGRYVAEAIAGQTSGADALASANQEMHDLLVREGVLS
jgi:multiple sugar transport system substrate-binding protein